MPSDERIRSEQMWRITSGTQSSDKI